MTGVASCVPSDAGEKLELMPVNSGQSVSNEEQCAYTNTRPTVPNNVEKMYSEWVLARTGDKW